MEDIPQTIIIMHDKMGNSKEFQPYKQEDIDRLANIEGTKLAIYKLDKIIKE